jgi:hypothetical protein
MTKMSSTKEIEKLDVFSEVLEALTGARLNGGPIINIDVM